VEKEYAVLVE
jgi:hypothetical protein